MTPKSLFPYFIVAACIALFWAGAAASIAHTYPAIAAQVFIGVFIVVFLTAILFLSLCWAGGRN